MNDIFTKYFNGPQIRCNRDNAEMKKEMKIYTNYKALNNLKNQRTYLAYKIENVIYR